LKRLAMETLHGSATDTWRALGGGGFFQSPDLGDLYAQTTRHRVLRFESRHDGVPTAYAQVILFREGAAALGSIATHGTIRHGPIVRAGAGQSQWTAVLRDITNATRNSVAYLRIYPGTIEMPGPTLARAGFERQAWLNFYVDLNQPERTLLSRMTKERRYGIRKASQRGVVVSTAESLDDVSKAYDLLLQTHKRARFPLEPRTFFNEAFKRFFPNHFQIFIAKSADCPLAVCVVVLEGMSAVSWYAGSLDGAAIQRLYPNDAAVWEAIRWSRSHGFSWFDLGGGGSPDDPRGFVKFKREFGGEETDVGQFTHVPRQWKFGVAKRGFDLVRRIHRVGR